MRLTLQNHHDTTLIFKQQNTHEQCCFKSIKLLRGMYAKPVRDFVRHMLSVIVTQVTSVYSARTNGDERASCMEMKNLKYCTGE